MFKCFEGENTSMCEAIRQMVDEGISMGQKQGSLNEKMTIARRLLEQRKHFCQFAAGIGSFFDFKRI